MNTVNPKRCGFVGIVGRPNVGKSTLMNAFLGKKVVITSNKPQTTRQRLLGIDSQDNIQRIYVDTPGIHIKSANVMNKMMNRSATSVLGEVDLILWLVIAGQWSKEDAAVLKRIKKCTCPVFVVVNQIDRCKDPTALLPYLSDLAERCQLNDYIPISAKTRDGLAQLQNKIDQALPQTDAFLFPEDQETNQSQSFRASEMIREKLFRSLGDELPYGLAVQIEYLTKEPKLTRIHAVIWVDKPNHKPMVIGKGGSLLKQIGSQARADIEHMLGQKVFLGLWVKVKSQWANNRQELHRLGYEDL